MPRAAPERSASGAAEPENASELVFFCVPIRQWMTACVTNKSMRNRNL